jgi:hypothetical protein
VESIQSSPILDRIYAIALSFRGEMIPAEIVLSPETHQKIVEESNFQHGLEAKKIRYLRLKGLSRFQSRFEKKIQTLSL